MPKPTTTAPILMYHKVGSPVHSRQDRFLNVSADAFARQMRVLGRLGYRARPFTEIVEAFSRRQTLPPRTLAITFDDGYQCIGDVAAPILAAALLPATVFVVSSGVGATNRWDVAEGRAELPLLGWEALRHLHETGWEIGGHTHTHPHLDRLGDAEALAEILQGKQETEQRLGISLQTFCYPFGHIHTNTPRLVREAGFLGACTTRSGIADSTLDPYMLPRVKVAYSDGAIGLLYRLLVRPVLPDLRSKRRSQRLASTP